MAIWCVMFLAYESYRISVQTRVSKQVTSEALFYEKRFPALEDPGWPSFLPDVAEALGGEYWNRDIVGIDVCLAEPDGDRLLKDLSRLQRLQNLQLRSAKLTTAQVELLARMKHLSWLLLTDTNLDGQAIAELRRALPRTYLTVL
jgi:hypothetical protein